MSTLFINIFSNEILNQNIKFSPVHHSGWLHSVLGDNMSDVGFGVVVMYTPEYAIKILPDHPICSVW